MGRPAINLECVWRSAFQADQFAAVATDLITHPLPFLRSLNDQSCEWESRYRVGHVAVAVSLEIATSHA